MDPIEKEPVSEILIETKKCCADCKTSKTPLWRAGPAGPKSLCNACGIRYRKKENSSVLGVIKGPEKRKEKPSTSSSSGGCGKLGADLGVRLIALGLGKEVVRLQRQRTSRKLGEEEQAAVLLMALSCGSVFA